MSKLIEKRKELEAKQQKIAKAFHEAGDDLLGPALLAVVVLGGGREGGHCDHEKEAGNHA